jgi:DNA-binding transcriptional regulator GbsR (MarR family)
MNRYGFEERKQVYEAALNKWGCKLQATVAIEEMAEVQKEITKMLRGQLDREHLAEEIADATIMLEQLRQMLNINESVCSWMDYKIAELKRKVEK